MHSECPNRGYCINYAADGRSAIHVRVRIRMLSIGQELPYLILEGRPCGGVVDEKTESNKGRS